MSKVRVYEIAKQLNMDQKSLVALFQSMGLGDVKNHMSAVEADVVERLKRHIERQKANPSPEERIRPTVVKRRAKPADEAPRSVPAASPSGAGQPSIPQSAPSQSGYAATPQPVVPRSAPSQTAAPAFIENDTPSPAPSTLGASPARGSAPAAAPSASRRVDPPSQRASATPERVEPQNETSEAVAPVARRSSTGARASAARASSTQATTGKVSPRDVDFDADVVAAPTHSEPVVETTREVLPPALPAESFAQAFESAARTPEPPAPVQPPPVEVRAPVASTPPPVETSSDAPKRPSSPPRTGIDVWQGRPGVPMPQARTGPPMARRTTYDPRAASPVRPNTSAFPQNRGPMQNRNRPGFRRPGQTGIPSSGIRRPAGAPLSEMAAHKKVIKIEEQVSLQKLASMMSLKVTDVLMRLLSMGMPGVNINSKIDSDTAKLLASEFGWTVEDVAVSEEATLEAAMGVDVEVVDSEARPRPPIVTVMGHVDHGKTSLLDRIRKATVAAGEAGGITQHIGAYRVETARGTIAFLDTPGHEAFTSMRARGAQLTDIVVLVVAADDGVMPQTREAVNHALSAKVPIIVAVNKIDKPGADVEKIRRELANLGLQPEEWGGQTLFCLVSALTGEGIDSLLENILLQSEVLELRASSHKRAHGTVIEALLDRGRGPVARVMVQEGTLNVGDVVLAGSAWGKVRAMTDEFGRALAHAGPSTPIEILGLNEVPSAGDPVHAVKDGKTAEEIAETRRTKQNRSLVPQDARVSLDALTARLAEADQLELKLIIKGDVQGSVEAVGAALIRLSTPKVKVTVVNAAVGGITEGDVNLAVASKAIIVGFNVRPTGKAASHAETGGIEIRLYNIIYNAVDDIRSAMEGLLPKTKIEKELGKAEIRAVFRITKVGTVAGCMVVQGLVRRGAESRVLRDGAVVFAGKISSIKRIKDDVREVPEGMECGISFDNFSDVKEGDIIEAFEVEEVKQKLG